MVFRNSNQEKSIQGIPFWEPTYFIGGKGKSSQRALKRQYLRVPRMVVMFMYHNCLRNPQSSISNHFWESGMFLKSHVLPLYFIPPPKKKNNCKPGPQKSTCSVASMIFHSFGRKWIPCLSILLLLPQNDKFKSSAVELSESDGSNDESHWHVISPIQSMGLVYLPTFGWYWCWISR